ncbi:MAG: MFS transporter, partial [Candidatus Hermodarchaeia archaeon]
QFMVNARRAIFYTFLTLFMAEALGANFIQLGLVITLPMLANSAMQAFVWGRLSDRIRRRRLLIVIGETFAGVGYLVIWTNITVWTIIIGLTMIEAVWSMSNTGWSALFADLTSPTERSTLMGRINSIGVGGRIFGAALMGFIYDFPVPAAGFHWGFPLAAGIMFGSVITLVTTVPEISRPPLTETLKTKSSESKLSWLERYPRNYLIFLGVWSFIIVGWTCYLSLFTYYLRLGLNLNSIEISLVRNVNSAVGLVAAPVAGILGDRIGRKPVIIGVMIVQAITSALYGFVNTLLGMLVVNAVNGVVRPSAHTVSYALVADMIPETQRGELFGTYNAVWTLSFGTSPTAVGGTFASSQQNIFLNLGYPLEAAQLQAIVDTFYLSAGLVVIGVFIFGLTVKEPEHKAGEPLVPHEEEEIAIMDTLD